MKKTSILKGAVFAGITAAAASSAQAQIATSPYVGGDAIVCFTSNSGNDLIVNLGLESSLYIGESWSLGSLLTGNLTLGANTPTWAVLAEDANNIYTTTPHGAAAPNAVGDFNGTAGAVDSIGFNISTASGTANPSASSANSFSQQNNPFNASSTVLANIYGVTGGAWSSTKTVQDFWAADQFGDNPSTAGLYTFTLAANGTLTYGAVSQPQLTITRSGANVILTWPSSVSGFTLQSNSNLAVPAGWTTVSPAPVVVGGQWTVTNQISSSLSFYRLKM